MKQTHTEQVGRLMTTDNRSHFIRKQGMYYFRLCRPSSLNIEMIPTDNDYLDTEYYREVPTCVKCAEWMLTGQPSSEGYGDQAEQAISAAENDQPVSTAQLNVDSRWSALLDRTEPGKDRLTDHDIAAIYRDVSLHRKRYFSEKHLFFSNWPARWPYRKALKAYLSEGITSRLQLAEPLIMVCQGCLKVVPYDQRGHEGAYTCACGSDFCGCPYCQEEARDFIILRGLSGARPRKGQNQ